MLETILIAGILGLVGIHLANDKKPKTQKVKIRVKKD